MITLEERLKQSVNLIENIGLSYALAGGIAASVYGEERLTKDVDFLLSSDTNVVEIAVEILKSLGLKPLIARQADFDGGPLFAIKRKNTPEVAVLGRDPQKIDPGVDFLLSSNPWVPGAINRAQFNRLDWGFAYIPTMTVEDVIIAKMLASHKSEREQDILDLRSIFRAKHELDLVYIVARMKDYNISAPRTLEKELPTAIRQASKRITRSSR